MKTFAAALILGFAAVTAGAQTPSVIADDNVLDTASTRQPFEYGVLFSGGNGVTDNRGGYHFLQAGVHVGRVLTNNFGHGIFRSNFEYAVELYPFWQAYTPITQKVDCVQLSGVAAISCSQPYNIGGTYRGVEFRPIILRFNFARHGRLVPWAQAAGGLLYTTHKFPPYGSTAANITVNGPNGETSVFNFTPQGGIGLHYFTRANRSIDVSANGEHISSASLGDRNPGVNASVQFSIGYSWWK